jgi:hypothetical protein
MDDLLKEIALVIEAIHKHAKTMTKHAQDLSFALNCIKKKVKETTAAGVVRDPRIDPIDGDVLWSNDGMWEILIIRVADDEVIYRVIDKKSGLLRAHRMSIAMWRDRIPSACKVKRCP